MYTTISFISIKKSFSVVKDVSVSYYSKIESVKYLDDSDSFGNLESY